MCIFSSHGFVFRWLCFCCIVVFFFVVSVDWSQKCEYHLYASSSLQLIILGPPWTFFSFFVFPFLFLSSAESLKIERFYYIFFCIECVFSWMQKLKIVQLKSNRCSTLYLGIKREKQKSITIIRNSLVKLDKTNIEGSTSEFKTDPYSSIALLFRVFVSASLVRVASGNFSVFGPI